MQLTEPSTLKDLFAASLERYPSSPALTFVEKTPWTYLDLGLMVTALQQRFAGAGLAAGDKVALLAENSPAWGAVYLAVVSAGLVVVPLLPDFAAREVKLILQHSGAKAVFVSEKQAPKLEGADFAGQVWPVEAVGETRAERLDIQGQPQPADLAAIIYTSGTTGDPKGVMLSHANITSNVVAARKIPDVESGQSMLSILPLSHALECTLGFLLPLSMGMSVHYLEKPAVASVLLPALKAVRPHLMLSVPLIMEKIFRGKILPEIKKSPVTALLYSLPPFRKLFHKIAGRKLKETFGGRLHFFGIGGAALAFEVDRFLHEARFPYAIGYGLTETSPLIAGDNPRLTTLRSTGGILEGVEVRVVEQAKNGIGQIEVRGPNVMQGYYKAPEKTAEVFTADGWLKTGDLGCFRGRRLYITGRSKNVILGANGENIYPENIEAVINEFRFVAESLVFEQGGKLLAKVHLNYQELLEQHKELAENAERLKQWLQHYLQDLKERVNHQLNSFSRIALVLEQPEPFEKTPTLKIKRFLYI